MLTRFIHEEDGQTVIEYALLLLFVALVVMAAIFVFGNRIMELFIVPETGLTTGQ